MIRMELDLKERQLLDRFYSTHHHHPYVTDFYETLGIPLRDFFVGEKTLRPEESWAARYLSRFLYDTRNEFNTKSILDLGCGTGIQGILPLLFGKAASLLAVDISEFAVRAAQINKILLRIPDERCEIRQSDLFAGVRGKYDVIIFNPPYFSGEASDDLDVIIKMPKRKFESFFDQYPEYLNPGGRVIMAYAYFIIGGNDAKSEASRRNIPYKERNYEDEKGEHSVIILDS